MASAAAAISQARTELAPHVLRPWRPLCGSHSSDFLPAYPQKLGLSGSVGASWVRGSLRWSS